MDYDDDDDDYNPPPKKCDTSKENDEDAAFAKLKRKSANLPNSKDEKSFPTKKQKLDVRVNDCKITKHAAVTNCSDGNTRSELNNSKDSLTHQLSNHLAEVADTRQSGGENHSAAPFDKSSSEGVVNG